MTQQAELLNKFERLLPILPPKYFGEVVDFMGYLERKTELEINSAANDNNGKIRFTKKEWEEFLQKPHPIVDSLVGIISNSENKTYDELRMEAMQEKYGEYFK